MKDYSFKRMDQAVSMWTKVKRKDRSVLSIDPQNLFNRLISLALVSSQDTNTQDNLIPSYELAPFPPSLFESDDLMREAHKPQIPDFFKKHHTPTPSDNAHKFKGTVVIDAGNILYTINRTKGNTFET